MLTRFSAVFQSATERCSPSVLGSTDICPSTYHQIGTQLGVSRERVRQLKEDALRKLRQPALCKRLSAYVE